MNNKILDVVIYVKDNDDIPHNAIASILNNGKYVRSVHFIHSNFGKSTIWYKDWKTDKEKLEDLNIKVQIDPELNVSMFEDNAIITEVPGNCIMTLGDFDNLIQQSKQVTFQKTTFGLGTKIETEEFSVWHGFLLIALCIEWVINKVFRQKTYSRHDIRCRMTMKVGGMYYLAPEFCYSWYLLNREAQPKQYCNATLQGQGYSFVSAYLRNHNFFSIGLWIFPFIPIWFATATSCISIIFLSYVWALPGIASILLCFFYSLLVGKAYLKTKYLLIYCILFPVYWIGFPLMLIFSKL